MTETATEGAYPAAVHGEPSHAPEEVLDEIVERRTTIEQNVERNEGIVAAIYQNVQRILAHHQLRPEYVNELALTLAEPLRFAESRKKLFENNIVVLVADADCGRHHTAVALLAQLDGVEPREVRREISDNLDLGALEIESNKGWLLDLRGELTLDDAFGRHLFAFRTQLKSRNSYLVVVVPSALWRRASEGAGDIAVFLESVSAADIVTAHLRYSHIEPGPYVGDEQIKTYLAHAGPSEAVRWVENIRSAESLEARQLPGAQQNDGPEDAQRHRVELVLQLHGRWRSELLKWHQENTGSRERHFLLAAAVLERLSAGLVFTTSMKTPHVLGEDEPEARGLAGPGILELVDVIGARLESDDTVSFVRPDYANAVLDYFWLDRQHLRTEFAEWLCRLPIELADDKHLSGHTRHVVQRIADYALRWTVEHKNTSLLWQVIRTWSQRSILREVLPLLLTVAALEESFGSKVREEMLTKARSSSETPEVKALIADVCGGDMAELHPTAALYRLAELAQFSDEQVTAAVTRSVERLWNIPSLRRRLTKTVAVWCSSEHPGQRQAGVYAFLSLASLQAGDLQIPELLSGDLETSKSLFDECGQGWRAVFNLQPESEDRVGAVLYLWVRSACVVPEILEPLQKILHAAVSGREGRQVDLRAMIYFNNVFMIGDRTRVDHISPEFREVRDKIAEYIFARHPQFDVLRQPVVPVESVGTSPHV
ncbi:hypothetical protein [Saccharothrix xinjiangensis]|uniref:Uncharacterized protein n=1 Tax=Saccharothrix xinjiangensis TaxID=204798 RepID=A0ABV9Y808_9PSEU